MDVLKNTIDLCKKYDIKPARSKGQNFLITENIFDEIVDVANITPSDTVLEVGPGLGFMTAKLAKKAKNVIAVELDDKLANILKTGLLVQGMDNVEVINENILDARIMNHESRIIISENGENIHDPLFINHNSKYKIVANLPYNITSVFIRKFLTSEHKPEMMVLMLQKEVAERICAQPGDMSLLAVSVQFYAEPEIVSHVSKDNFWPQPEVDSAIIRILPFTKNRINGLTVDKEKDFFRLVKFGFSAKRKMLKNNLAGGLKIEQKMAENYLILANILPKARAEDLSIEDWIKLFDVMKEKML